MLLARPGASSNAGRRARLLDETTAALAQRLGRAPTQDELAQELGVDQAELGRMLLESAHVIVSLDGSSNGGEDDGAIAECLQRLIEPVGKRVLHLSDRNGVRARLRSVADPKLPIAAALSHAKEKPVAGGDHVSDLDEAAADAPRSHGRSVGDPKLSRCGEGEATVERDDRPEEVMERE